ncbi:uncharacterized protein LOC110459754 isoform X2 [Mizuhopecten yessoensis]|uniref:uncharacterized protein LOC110459754 isoform X2 n=1 Tax=Mizuhopecten yessoensis TaxID=6573 RepID=UPI000B4588B1|nr:uncharacterized protein LOC110459754 isoform X2 [Mizuhopecten yessoensis]
MIDETVVSTMTAEQLSKYLPRYGDCLAAIAFSKQHPSSSLSEASQRSKDRRISLRDRLLAKLQGKKGDEHVRRSVPQEGNKNAKKTSRKIELGWLHTYGACGTLKQVRSPNGGGTRTVDIDVNATISELLTTAKGLFFPNGKSKKGNEKDFDFYVANQTHERQESDFTVKQIFESTKLKILRFYLVTSPAATASTDNSADKKTQPQSKGNPFHCLPDADTLEEFTNSSESGDVEDLYSMRSFTDDDIPSELLEGSNETLFDPLLFEPLEQQEEEELSNVPQALQPYIQQGQPNSPPASQEHAHSSHIQEQQQTTDPSIITLHRTMIQEELIQHFKNPSVINAKLSFSFVNERGQDADGVSRDAYSGFWTSFLLRNTDGETYRVPVLTNEYSLEEWEAIGRILLKGYQDHRYLPTGLAPVFLIAIVHGEDVVSPQQLKDSFFNYLAQSEKEVLEAACRGSLFDEDELLGVLDRFQCHRIPQLEEMNSTVIQIAHRVLIQEPKYALDAMRNVSGNTLQLLLPDIASISSIYTKLNPTVTKVLGLLHASPTTKEENASFGFLKRFVRGRNNEQLKQFIRFLTGSDVVCVDKIEVTFVLRYGKGRVPTIHTCGPTLELPSTYVNFPDFRSEWESILSNTDSMEMSIA